MTKDEWQRTSNDIAAVKAGYVCMVGETTNIAAHNNIIKPLNTNAAAWIEYNSLVWNIFTRHFNKHNFITVSTDAMYQFNQASTTMCM